MSTRRDDERRARGSGGRGRAGGLGTVVAFEFLRTIKKRSFWIGTLALPLLIVVVGVLVGAGNAAGTDAATGGGSATKVAFAYVDHSGLVRAQTAKRSGGVPTDDAAAARRAVRSGDLAAFVEYPTSPSSSPIRVTANDAGLFGNAKYSDVAERVLERSVTAQLGDAEAVRIVKGNLTTDVTAYENGAIAPGWGSIIPPLLFVAAFFGLVVLLAARMVTVVVEEKENRISEMILTTLDATVLIRGKVIAMLLVGVVQIGIFLVPTIITASAALPLLASSGIGAIPVEPGRMVVGALLLIGGVLLGSSLFVTVGAAVPTIKDASALQSVAVFSLIIPLYGGFYVVTNPHTAVAAVFTYFPTFTPFTAMLRNAFGVLSPIEATICIVELFVAAFVMLRFAVFLFRHSVAQYGSRVSLSQVRAWRSSRRAD